MPPLTDEMTEPDRPVTRRELREELEYLFAHDGVRANTENLDKRVRAVESGHGGRLLRLETRVTAVELGHPRKKV